MRHRFALVVLLATAFAVPTAGAESRLSSEASAAARLDFRIAIPTILKVHALAQPASLELTEQDIGRGFVDVAEGSRVRLTSNGRRGFSLAVAFDPSWVARVVVRTPLREFAVEASGGAAEVPTASYGEQELPVTYRIYLKPGARSGVHRWPVGLSFASIGI